MNSALVNPYQYLPVAVYTCDVNGYFTSFNDAAVKLWGQAPEIGVEHVGYYIPERSDTSLLPSGNELTILRPDGSRRYVSSYSSAIHDSSGNISGSVYTLIDITDKKQDETKQAMLAAIIESSDDAIISKMLDGCITSWNHGAERIFGYQEEEVLGKHITMLIPPDRQQEEQLIIERIRRSERIDHFETVRLAKSGREIPISLGVSPIRDSRGKVIGASKILRDITVQKSAEQRLHSYAENLESALSAQANIAKVNATLYEEIKTLNAKKDEFIGLASHELKTPLTTIQGYVQLIERRLDDADRNKPVISKVHRQLRKVTALISDLLDVTKIQTGQLNFSYAKFDLVFVLREIADLMQQTHESHQITLVANPEFLLIHADLQRIEQVIINLISNAIKYSPDANSVKISLKKRANSVQVCFQDFGIGIDAGQLDKIFSRFYRVENVSPHISGLGIGLYISHEIILRHKGRIWAESTAHQGATFCFELPLD